MTKTYLKLAILKLNHDITEMEGSHNPQIQKEVIKMKAELSAFEAVLESLKGEHLLLRLYT